MCISHLREWSTSELVTVPAANLHAVPDSVADEFAVFTEPLAAAFEILEQVQVESGQDCVVLGDGKLGLLVAQVLQNAGAHVIAVGRHPAKLAILERRDIETVLAAHQELSRVGDAYTKADRLARRMSKVAQLPDEIDNLRLNLIAQRSQLAGMCIAQAKLILEPFPDDARAQRVALARQFRAIALAFAPDLKAEIDRALPELAPQDKPPPATDDASKKK